MLYNTQSIGLKIYMRTDLLGGENKLKPLNHIQTKGACPHV
nr:MAG TPA: hypothetical protein [Caudoviricetes sp.]